MSKKKTHDEYVAEVAIKNPKLLVIGKYIDAKTKIMHRCLIHNVDWNVTPDNVLHGKGCLQCRNEATGNRSRCSHEEYVKKLKRINPKIDVLGQYKNTNTPILHRCIVHNIEWNTTPASTLQGCGCLECKKEKINIYTKRSHEQYEKELVINNPRIEVVEEYINSRTPILHHCLIHDVFWKVSPYHILNGAGCLQCRNDKTREVNKKCHNDYVLELSVINPDIEVVGKYVNVKTPILHRCIIHNFEWETTPGSILQGGGCPQCRGEKIRNKLVKSDEQYSEDLKAINPDIIVLGKYVNSSTPILHKCLIDEYEWYAEPRKILFNDYGCPVCNESKGERKIRQWLNKNNIKFEYQKLFERCRDIKSLPFDFYLPNYNSCIEFDGIQHYEPIEHFGGQENFEYIVKHDNIKNEYCKNNGIPLLRIPYFKNVEEELNNFLFI